MAAKLASTMCNSLKGRPVLVLLLDTSFLARKLSEVLV